MRLLVEMFRLMDMPANCRLLFPRMLDRALDGGWKDTRRESGGHSSRRLFVGKTDTICKTEILKSRFTITRTITTKLLYTDEIAHFKGTIPQFETKKGQSLVADLDLLAY